MQAAHVMHVLVFALINDAGSACDARLVFALINDAGSACDARIHVRFDQ